MWKKKFSIKIKCEAKKKKHNIELYRIYIIIYDHSPIQIGNKTINAWHDVLKIKCRY